MLINHARLRGKFYNELIALPSCEGVEHFLVTTYKILFSPSVCVVGEVAYVQRPMIKELFRDLNFRFCLRDYHSSFSSDAQTLFRLQKPGTAEIPTRLTLIGLVFRGSQQLCCSCNECQAHNDLA